MAQMNSGLAQISVTSYCSYPPICDDPLFICVICVKKEPRSVATRDEPQAKKNRGEVNPLRDSFLSATA